MDSRDFISDPLEEHKDVVEHMTWSQDGRYLASTDANSGGGVNKWTIAVWEILNGNKIDRKFLFDQNSTVTGLVFSPDSRWLASAAADGTVMIWKIEIDSPLTLGSTVIPESIITPDLPTMKLAYSSDGRFIAKSDCERLNALCAFQIWDIEKNEPINILGNVIIQDFVYLPNNELVVLVYANDRFHILKIVNNQIEKNEQLQLDSSYLYETFLDRDGNVVFLSENRVSILDFSNQKLIDEFDIPLDCSYYKLKMLRPPFILIECHKFTTTEVQVWDRRTMKMIGEPLANQLLAGISPDGRIMITREENNRSKFSLWDLRTYGFMMEINTSFQSPIDPIISYDGSLIATGSYSSVGLWDITTGQQIVQLAAPGLVNTLAFRNDGQILLVGGCQEYLWAIHQSCNHGEVKVIEIGSAILQDRACTIAGRNLTMEEWQLYLSEIPYHKTCDEFTGAN